MLITPVNYIYAYNWRFVKQNFSESIHRPLLGGLPEEQVHVGERAVLEGALIGWMALDCLAVVRNSAVVIVPVGLVDQGTIELGRGVIWIATDGLAVFSDRMIVILLFR